MKFLKFISKFWFIHLVLTIILVLAIMCFGPKLTYNNNAFLQDLKIRVFLVVLLMLIWILLHLQIGFKERNLKNSVELSEENASDFLIGKEKNPLKLWQQQFPEIRNLPILLISGHKNSVAAFRGQMGAALAEMHSGAKQFPIFWQFYQELIIVELDQKLPLSTWSELLSMLKAQWQRIIGLVYTFSAMQLLNIKEAGQKLEQQKLIEFGRRLPRTLPIYVVIAQLEQITGFKEFFAHGAPERQQCFGFNLLKNNENYLAILKQELNSQIENLRSRRIAQLAHVKPGSAARVGYFFPNKFEQLAKNLMIWLDYLDALNQKVPLIDAVFFNAMSPGKQIPNFTARYFLEFVKLSAQNIKNNNRYVNYDKTKKTGLAWGLGFIVYLIFLTVWSESYIRQQDLLLSFQQELNSSAVNHVMLDSWRNVLSAQSFWLNAGLGIKASLQEPIEVFDEKLALQELNEALSSWFNKNLPNEEGLQLYGDLRAYLMLGALTHRDISELSHWFSAHQNDFSISMPKFKNYLDSGKILTLDPNLVIDAQKKLQKLSGIALAYGYLKAHSESEVKLVSDADMTSLSVFVNLNATIPEMYTKAWLKQNYLNISTAAIKKNTQDWVMGIVSNNAAALPEDLLNLYLKEYVTQWQQRLLSLKIVTLTDLNQAAQVVSLLAQDHSVFESLLNNFYDNTHFEGVTNNDLLGALAYINKAFAANEINAKEYASVKTNLQGLSQQLNQLLMQPPENHAILTLVIQHFSGASDDALSHLEAQINFVHSPLKEWLQSLVNQLWQLLLVQARAQLNVLWQQNIGSVYQASLANRYPFQNSGSQEVSLADFNAFFAPDGVFNKFYHQYLQMFINHTSGLSNRVVRGYSMAFSKIFLAQLQKIQNIQKTFFATGKSQAAMNFTLRPWDLSATVAQINLTIANQMIIYGHGPLQDYQISWPGAHQNIEIDWQGVQPEQKAKVNLEGVWSLFRLLQNAEQELSPYGLKVTLQQGMGDMSFLIKTGPGLNPFVTEALELTLPQQLY
jgi:type VI protein secretion system component VasK